MRRASPFRQTEAQLVAACLQWLALHRALAWRQNQGQMHVPDETRAKGFRRIVFAGARGISDIIGALPCGCFVAVECKVGKNTLTQDQRAFLERVRRVGGVGLEIREVCDLVRLVEAHEAVCRKREGRSVGAA